jgi:hypothetical protein
MRIWRWRVAGLLAAMLPASLPAQAPPAAVAPPEPAREPTDIHIRRLVGLPPESARGNIEILDVGHSPLSPMVSIVADRVAGAWRVSYVCAESDWCTADRSADHHALAYTLAPATAAKLDAALAALAKTGAPDGTAPSPTMLCGHLDLRIDLPGFRRDFSRGCFPGDELGTIRQLVSPIDLNK